MTRPYGWFVLVLVLSLLKPAYTATVTLFGVSAPAPASTTTATDSFEVDYTDIISAIGTGTDGVTTYQDVQIISLEVDHLSDRNRTLLSVTITEPAVTYAEGASRLVLSEPLVTNLPPIYQHDGIQESCDLDPSKGSGSCIFTDVFPVETTKRDGSTVTVLETTVTAWTGPLVPFATVTTNAGSTLQDFSRIWWMLLPTFGFLTGMIMILL